MSYRSSGVCSTSGRAPKVSHARGELARHLALRNATRHTRSVATLAAKVDAVDDISPEEAQKLDTLSVAFQARLDKLYAEAPDDVQLGDLTEEAMHWDEDELIKEGEQLKLAQMAAGGLATVVEEVRGGQHGSRRVLHRVCCPGHRSCRHTVADTLMWCPP